jgi:hypothetical protein
MDEQTRYRVTGSLFLLALAIICLPMLFDGEGMASIVLDRMDPPEPAPRVTPMEDIAPSSDFVAQVDELRSEVDEDGFLNETGALFGEPLLSDPTPASRSWAVQVASFAEQENALKFRTELREQGYEALISTLKASGSKSASKAVQLTGTVSPVRVSPPLGDSTVTEGDAEPAVTSTRTPEGPSTTTRSVPLA